jgi:hypothetical protein
MKLVVESPMHERDSVPVAIRPGEEAALRHYLAEYDRLMSCRPLQKEIPCGVSFTTSPESGVAIESNLPGADDRAILLHRLRPFVLESEPASFARVASILGRRISQPVVRELIRMQRRFWSGQAFTAQSPIKINGRRLNGERFLTAWLNGEEYHRDSAKATAFESLRGSPFFPLFDWILVNLLTDKLRAITNLAALTGVVLGVSSELQFRGHRLVRGDS